VVSRGELVTATPPSFSSPFTLASLDVRPLASHAEFAACVRLQRATWGDAFADAVPASILKVAQRIGGVAIGAFTPANDLVGFVFGLTGVERGHVVHWSDMLAVRPDARDIGLGRRLKEHQRRAVRDLGAEVIYWTSDPLVARNAHLNFNRLGVRLAEYVDDMYGITGSALHGGVPTDRLIVAWPTGDDEIGRRLADAERVLASVDCRQAPVATVDWIERAGGATILPHCLRVEIPLDAERLLAVAPDEAALWRDRVRRSMRWALGCGYTASAFFADASAGAGYYLMTRARPVATATGPASRA
jgi:predicted GNAT superfamily acetyltransferase